MRWAGIFACALFLAAVGSRAQSNPTPPDFKIAFIGDQGSGANARAVLELIAAEGADAVVHSGDFDYGDDPAAWDALIDAVLGADFPYFASAGNHDDQSFRGASGYQARLEARMTRLGIPWSGDLGVRSVHEYEGILFVLTAPGIFANGDGDSVYAPFIRDQLSMTNAIWRISSWHKNMNAMQVGGKSDDTGWGVYEESRRGGAIIATGHEHSYSRTHLLREMATQTCVHVPDCNSPNNTLVLEADDPLTPGVDEGASFVFVSGLGGKSVRVQKRDGPYWAAIHTSDQGAAPGALFGVFNLAGDPRMARFTFVDLGPDGVVSADDRMVDDFFVRSEVGVDPDATPIPEPGTVAMMVTALLVVAALRAWWRPGGAAHAQSGSG